ncbi:MAG: potassium channel family protein, partial [Myxococcota bacterium]
MRRLAPVYQEPTMPWWWDRLIIGLTVLAIGLLLSLEVADLAPGTVRQLELLDVALCGVFLADFAVRLKKAKNHRLRFLRRNWLDLLGAIPIAGPLRTARVMRVVRILRFARLAALGRRLVRHYDLPVAPTTTFLNLVAVTTLVWVLAAWSFYSFELGENESITGFGDALWWSMTTLSTVGYGDLYPVTDGGRVVAVGTMIFGVGILGILAGTIAT